MEVDITYPCFYMTRLWLHCYKAAMHKAHHIADRVHRREFFLNTSLLVIEHLYFMRQIQVIIDRILVAIEFLREIFVYRLSLSDILDKVLDFNVALILPRIRVAPVAIESFLYLLHLFECCLFGIFLHTCVDGGIDFQSLCIERITIIEVVLAPAFQIVGYSLSEVIGITIIGTFHTVIEFYLFLFQCVACFLSQVAMLAHQVEYNIATLKRVLRVDKRVIISCCL